MTAANRHHRRPQRVSGAARNGECMVGPRGLKLPARHTVLSLDQLLQRARAMAGESHLNLNTHVVAGHPVQAVTAPTRASRTRISALEQSSHNDTLRPLALQSFLYQLKPIDVFAVAKLRIKRALSDWGKPPAHDRLIEGYSAPPLRCRPIDTER